MTSLDALNTLKKIPCSPLQNLDEAYEEEFEAIEQDLQNIDSVEEEFGIKLTILFEALEKGIWVITYENHHLIYKHLKVRSIEKKGLRTVEDDCVYYYAGYKKMWSIKKRDLYK